MIVIASLGGYFSIHGFPYHGFKENGFREGGDRCRITMNEGQGESLSIR